MRLEPRPRAVDGGILVAVLVAFATGLASLVSGRPADARVFALHGVAGLVLVPLLAWKLRRVAPRLRPDRWGRATLVSALTTALAVGTLATGVYWTLGGDLSVLFWNAMNVHVGLGLALMALLVLHLRGRLRLPRRVDFEGRRTALQSLLLVGGAVLAWRLGRGAAGVLGNVGAAPRFTGSRERGLEPGNTFPATSWVADDPVPVDPGTWRLRVGGAVERPFELDRGDIRGFDDRHRATLDCTSGWYTTQRWAGVRVGRLLDRAVPDSGARWVRFTSVTGYRFSLPLDEARAALLATRVGGEALSHDHGSPARLVAPGRRGFQWVKWVESVEVLTEPDYGQWAAIFTSGFTGRGTRRS